MPIPIRWSFGVLLALLVGAQFVRPDRTNPSSPASASLAMKMPQDVRAIVERSCRDCHSNQTRWPWYSNIAPASWLLATHVHNGRDTFNYSQWTSYSTDDQDKFLGAMCSLAKRGRMPVPSYLWLHRDAVLSASDVSAICAWSEKMRDTLP
jgi:Haem-binding domain